MPDWNEVGPELVRLFKDIAEELESLDEDAFGREEWIADEGEYEGQWLSVNNRDLLLGRIRDAITKAEEISDDPWEPIETLRKDGTWRIFWMPKKHMGCSIHTGTLCDGGLSIIGGYFAFDLEAQPTYHQPLPEPPKEKGDV